MSSCPYEARGEACRCYDVGTYGHLAPSQVAVGEKLGDIRVVKNGPLKGRRYIKTASGWQRMREAR